MKRISGSITGIICLFLVISVLAGCARSSLPAEKTTAPPAPASPIPTSAENVAGADAVAMLKNQVSALGVASFEDTSTWGRQRDALVSAVDLVNKDMWNGEYKDAQNTLKDQIQDVINRHIVGKERQSLDQLASVISDCVENAAKTTVLTKYGKIAGQAGYVGTWAWKGVPYAKPPVGDLRWRAPQDLEPWTGVRQSTDTFSVAVQPAVSTSWVPLGHVIGSEDCLYLDIWRPNTQEKNLPVYFWIHGGGNNFGSGKIYEESVLASQSNMVVVTIQYRLGPLGWFNHPALKEGASKEESSGNFGLLDAIKALQWVRDNIEAFGGNPGNVTVAGESAGGRNALSLLISPVASGLFHRIISESGGMRTISVDAGVADANATIDRLLVADDTAKNLVAASKYRENMSNEQIVKYLRSTDATDLIKAQTTDRGMPLHSAFADGFVIPDDLATAISSGNYNHGPVIMGCNEYELKPFLPLYGANIPTTNQHHWRDLYQVLNGQLTLDEVLPSQFDKDLYEDCGYYGTRAWKARYVDSIARTLKEKQDDVYCYFFKWGGPGSGPYPYDFIIGAGHATEIPFFFGWPRDTFGYAFTEQNEAGRVELQKAVMSYMAQFAATGNPNRPGSSMPVWEKWSNDTGGYKCIVWDATFTQARIGVLTEELTLTGVQAEVEKLPLLVKTIVKLWLGEPVY